MHLASDVIFLQIRRENPLQWTQRQSLPKGFRHQIGNKAIRLIFNHCWHIEYLFLSKVSVNLNIENATTFVCGVLGCLRGQEGRVSALFACFPEGRGERLVVSILFFKKYQKF